MWSSSVPAAMAGLVAALQGSDVLTGVDVLDGPTANGSSASKALIVGSQPDDTPIGVEGLGALDGYGIGRTREQYSINCAAIVVDGSGVTLTARTAAYQLVGAVGAVLVADQTLGGAVMSSRISAISTTESQDPRGIRIYVQFAVECDAFTTL